MAGQCALRTNQPRLAGTLLAQAVALDGVEYDVQMQLLKYQEQFRVSRLSARERAEMVARFAVPTEVPEPSIADAIIAAQAEISRPIPGGIADQLAAQSPRILVEAD